MSNVSTVNTSGSDVFSATTNPTDDDTIKALDSQKPLFGAGERSHGGMPTAYSGQGSNAEPSYMTAFPKSQSGVDLGLLVMQLSINARDVGSKTSEARINSKQGEIEGLNREQNEKIEESVAKMAKAEKGGLFGKIFGWIATVASLIGGALTLNPALVAIAVIGMGMQIANETGLTEKIAELMGPKAFAAVMGVLAVAMMVVAPMALPSSVASASTVVGIAAASANVVNSASTVTQSGFQIDTAIQTRDSAMAGADSKKIEAMLERSRAGLDDLFELFSESQTMHDSTMRKAQEIIKSSAEAAKFVASNKA